VITSWNAKAHWPHVLVVVLPRRASGALSNQAHLLHGLRMADPTFSVIQKDGGWFWCSLTLMSENKLIGPFPSHEEAEKDARATLGIGEGE
jgi:hypothetical protein